MSLLPFVFDDETHVYTTPGQYCLATSDIIDLAGLSDTSQIPVQTLRHACYRGKVLHKAIELYEHDEDWQSGFDSQFMDFMHCWFAFREAHDIEIVGPAEMSYVYLHEGAGQAVGATIDLRFLFQGNLWIGDLKFIHPVSGKALRMKQLAWRCQTESYRMATELDESFLRPLNFQEMRRCVIHCHPKLKNQYALHEFRKDDAMLWYGAVEMAKEKTAAGAVPMKRSAYLEMGQPETVRAQFQAAVDADIDPDASWDEQLRDVADSLKGEIRP